MPTNPNEYVDSEDLYTEESGQSDQPQPESEKTPEPPAQELPAQELPEDQPEPEPTQDHPYDAEYRRLGLDREFQGGVIDVLNRVPFMRKWQTQLSQENAELKRYKEENERRMAESQRPSANEPATDFWENPYPSLDQRYVPRDTFQQFDTEIKRLQNEIAMGKISQFEREHPDFKKLQDEGIVRQVIEDEPGLVYLKDPLTEIYKRAKSVVAPKETSAVEGTKNTVNRELEQRGQRAETAGTVRKPPAQTGKQRLSHEELAKMPLDKLRDYFGGYSEEDY